MPTLSRVMHCWGGTPEEMATFLALGFYISFSGTVTFSKAEGIQVAELQTDESAGPAGEPDPNTRKPQPVAIGDSTRQIKPAANAPGVVGAQVPAGNTQQMEKATGGAAKGSSGNSGNRGVEKGRAMPAGL